MKETASVAQAAIASEAVVPARVQEALGELVGAAKEGLLALSVGFGLGVMADDGRGVCDVVGAKGEHDADRTAVRHGHEAGVSTRRFKRTREPVGDEVEGQARSTSKSAVSREFVARTRESLDALMSRRLDDVRLAVMMIDGIDLRAAPTSSRWGSAPRA